MQILLSSGSSGFWLSSGPDSPMSGKTSAPENKLDKLVEYECGSMFSEKMRILHKDLPSFGGINVTEIQMGVLGRIYQCQEQ